ncbi:glycosyl transferase [Sinorhizobium sp. BG8]|uniref:O-linked N-acetylglucosamine transferase, SPINDLY family protein n=1 Tax=Sinorhizobium sp. BG8 TaxID=2613773 RepID=UPI001FEECE05|nr:glycosyl transferase [Sinorhizobium sp. BG8]
MERARNQTLPLAEVFQIAEGLNAAGQRAQAAELYKSWIAFNDGNPLLHLVYFNYSVTLRQLGDIAGSIHALRACLKLDPKFGPAHINLGRALEDCGLAGQAIQQWRSYAEATSEVTPDRLGHRLMTLQHIGRVLEGAGILEEAEAALWQAIELQPDRTEAGQHWTSLRQTQCKWPTLVPSLHVTARQLLDAMSPLTLGCYSDDPLFQLAKAYRYNKSLVGRPDLRGFPRKPPRQKSGTAQRLRIGYVSSDLRDHAVGFALSEVLELHDKSSVEIFAYYCGEARVNDPTQERIKRAVDCWRDISAQGDEEAAAQIFADEIDVLVDVNGYTKHARTKIFAYRPAPVIVNFCGYPGSMASPFHQYIIADEHILPPENEIYYSEKVLRIACNQPIDRKRQIGARPSRAEAGLPEDAFIFASFNGMKKITANCFARWMAILSGTPGSVLWLLGGDAGVNERLREAATQAGVAPERLIFASKASNPNHLARIGLADLFLDTFPYGAHSTAADAITMGLPVLTISGKSFASRFCGSIVSAAGVPELICSGPDEYVSRAIAFAHDRQSLAEIRESLQRQRETSALRDIPGLASRLEELFWQMQGEAERGETPVPDLQNLDIYYEIGAEIVLQNIEFEDDHSYRQRYLEKLTEWDNYAPLARDSRLWSERKA